MRVRPHNCCLRIPDSWRLGYDATVDVMIAWDHKHSFHWATTGIGKFLEPRNCHRILLWISLEGDVAANQEGTDRPVLLNPSSGVLNHPRPKGPVRVGIWIDAVRGSKMDVGDMEQQHLPGS